MKFVVFTFDGHGLPLAYKLKQEGQDVVVGQIIDPNEVISSQEEAEKEDDEYKQRRLALFEGMVEKIPAHKLVDQLKKVSNPQDYFLFFDLNSLFRYADELKDLGFHGNFVTEEDYLFEVDRDGAKDFVRKYYPKLNIAEIKEFKKVSEAVRFLEKTDEVWVLKANDENASAVVPDIDDPELAARQLIQNLEQSPELYEGKGFILELLIPNVMEFTPEKLYYDGVPIATTLCCENKPLGAGNISVMTGCAADIVFPTDMEDRINKIAFPPIVDEMAKKHKGLFIWDASILINKRDGKMYFGEFCSNRPGYNSIFTELCQLPSTAHFFESLTKKENPFTLGTVGTSIRIFNLHRDERDIQVLSGMQLEYKPEIWKDLWFFDARIDKKGRLINVGDTWNLAVMTGSGKSINEAVNRLYKNMEGFSFLEAYYRPKADYLSLGYSTSLINRLNYGLERNLYRLPFMVKVGDIKSM